MEKKVYLFDDFQYLKRKMMIFINVSLLKLKMMDRRCSVFN